MRNTIIHRWKFLVCYVISLLWYMPRRRWVFACTKTTVRRYLTWCLYSLYKCISLVAYASNCWLVILVFTDALFTCAILNFVQDLIRMHIKWFLFSISKVACDRYACQYFTVPYTCFLKYHFMVCTANRIDQYEV